MNTDEQARNRILERIRELESNRRDAAEKFRKIEQQYELAFAKLDEKIRDTKELYEFAWEPTADTPDTTQQVTKDQLQNAKTHTDRLALLAMMNDNRTVNATEAAHLFIALSLTKAKKRHMVANAFQIMDESDQWEKVSPGTFKYLGKPE